MSPNPPSREELVGIVRRVLHDVAPDVDVDALDLDADLRDATDIDSVDFLNFVVGLHDATGVDIPESAYPNLETLRACADYLSESVRAT